LGGQQFYWVREKLERFPVCGQHLDRSRERVDRVGNKRLPVFGRQQFFVQGKITGRKVTSLGKIKIGQEKIKGKNATSFEKVTMGKGKIKGRNATSLGKITIGHGWNSKRLPV
jgi:hypothetical protein